MTAAARHQVAPGRGGGLKGPLAQGVPHRRAVGRGLEGPSYRPCPGAFPMLPSGRINFVLPRGKHMASALTACS